MIFLCDIQQESHSLKLAFHRHNIKYGDNFYSASYHKAQPYFQLHHHNDSEHVIIKLKSLSDCFLQKSRVLFYCYNKEKASLLLETDIYKILQGETGVTLICNTMKTYFKRHIGRLYSDIL